MSKVATRFAPSPTGALHIGGVRTALFNWLYSKNKNGTFHLRIEDTDKERSKNEHKAQIIKSLKWIGIEHDGELYIQSTKIKDHISVANDLLKNGQYFGLKVQGDSMIEAGINEGDTVIIKRSDTADNGKIVVALIDEHEAMLKRMRRKGKTVALESENRNYETKIFGPDRVKVQGVLVSLYRNF